MREALSRPNRAHFIERESLTNYLSRVPTGSLVSVIGGAGFGKTSLLESWLDVGRVPSVIIPLDERHNDAAELARHIVGRLALAIPALSDFSSFTTAPGSDWVRNVLTRLASELSHSPTIPMFDDAHLISDPRALRLLETFVTQHLQGGIVVLAGRHLPLLRLDHEKAKAYHLTSADLRITAQDLTAGSHGTMTHTLAEEIVRTTHGWPSAVRVILREHRSGRLLMESVGTTDPGGLLALYLRDEVVSDLDDDLRRLLTVVATAGPLDKKAIDSLIPDVNLASALKRASALDLPLVTVSPEDKHPLVIEDLLANVLAHDLRRTDPAKADDILVRAAKYFSARGKDQQAFDNYLKSEDRRLLLEFVADRGIRRALRGDSALVRQWLEAFSPAEMVAAPILLLTGAILAASECDLNGMEQWLTLLAQATSQGNPLPTKNTQLMAAALREITGIDPMGEAFDAASSILEGPFAALAQIITAVTYNAAGQLDLAQNCLDECAVVAKQYPLVYVQHLAASAANLGRRNDLEGGLALIQTARRIVDEQGLSHNVLSVSVEAGEAWYAARMGATSQAAAALSAGRRKLSGLTRGLKLPRLCWVMLLSEAALALGDFDAAESLVSDGMELLTEFPEAMAVKTILASVKAACPRHRAAPSTNPLTATEMRVLKLLPGFWTVPRMASELNMATPTIRHHIQAIYRTLGVHDRAEAVSAARARGLLPS